MIGQKIADKLLKPINTSVVSILGFSNFLMGLWLALPLDSLGTTYSGGIFQEWVYGGLLMLIGALVVIGSLKSKHKSLQWGTGLGFIFWFTWWGFLISHTPQHIDWIWTFTFALYYGFVWLNTKVNKHNFAS